MKVTNENGVRPMGLPVGPANAERVGASSFGAILEETMGVGDVSQPSTNATATVSGVQALDAGMDPAGDRGRIADRVEAHLGTLERYQERLGNARVDAGDLAPLVRELEQEGEGLERNLSVLDERDDLHSILQESLAVSTREVTRFARGDYR